MLVIRVNAHLAALSLFCAQPVLAQPSFDGHYQPRVTEGEFAFTCGDLRAKMRYRQERRPLEGDRIEEALRVTLLDLSVADRNLSADEMQRVRAALAGYAWIDRVEAICFSEHIYIHVKGMPLDSWARHVREEARVRPDLVTTTIQLSVQGLFAISR